VKPLLVLDRWIEKFAIGAIVFLLSVMIVLAFGQVVMRDVFHSALPGVDVLLRHLVLWVGYFGAIIATGHRRHLRIEVVELVLSERARVVCAVVANLFAAAICVVLLRAAISFVRLERQESAALMIGLPAWVFAIVVPVGYAAIGFRFAARAIEIIAGTPEVRRAAMAGPAEARVG
jgi:TRAP-type C4-dicarboxylate transport system permease small subunit